MRMSQLFGKTLRQPPADAETANHQRLLRAGLVQQTAAGIYSFLPLGYRALRRIEQIAREEMDAAGGQEVHLPVLSPAELWEESGRLGSMGGILMTLQDRRERTLVLGPTHEEVITDLVRRNVRSYRDLPLRLYQIQTKFRDEARPRGGLLRGREFIMKDLYSFDRDWEGLDTSYAAMLAAYKKIFARCGVPAVPVLADSGAIGGKESQEFLYLTEIGEDEVLICPNGDYAANAEKAAFRKPALPAEPPLPLTEVSTPGQKTIEDLMAFLGVPAARTLKAVFMEADGEPLFVAIRGDMQVNVVKLANALHAATVEPMNEATVARHGLVPGSAGPVGLNGMRIVADEALPESPNLVTGANRPDLHLRNVNYGRDWQAEIVADIALARAGDACPVCGAGFDLRRGIELGHVFKLGTRYSEAMDARYLDERGEQQPCIMGCYGIGITRLLAAAIEANHDERGIVWPQSLAPYPVQIVALNSDRPEVREAAEPLYAELLAAGIEPLLDDRDEAAGVKFNDADLLGMPLRITVSPRNLANGTVEIRRRRSGETTLVPLAEAVDAVRAALTQTR
ncbi:MAG TPA: proline--tRNA ligase [Dehalococcoidia bacterium]|jgi:prolyl-tRNA synthetase